MPKSKSKPARLSIEDKRRRIIAYDIIEIYEESYERRFDYLVTLMTGDGTSPALRWTDKQVLREWNEGDYDNPDDKEYAVKNSSGYYLVKELWP